MKDPSATMPITAQVNKNVEHFIKRAVLMGYIGKNEDKVSLGLSQKDLPLTIELECAVLPCYGDAYKSSELVESVGADAGGFHGVVLRGEYWSPSGEGAWS